MVLASRKAWVDGVSLIVSDGDTRTALAAVRSLGSAGARVQVLVARRGSLAGGSRHAEGEILVPDPGQSPGLWAAAVARVLAERSDTWLLPVTEVALGSVYESGLHANPRVIAPPRSAYEEVVDKLVLLERARQCGWDVPLTWHVPESTSGEAEPPIVRYPVVVKPRRSCWVEAGRWARGTARIAEDSRALQLALADPTCRGDKLVQEFIPGRGEALFFLTDHGLVRASFAHRRLREKPPVGGVSVLSESIDPDPRLLRRAEDLLRALSWHGVAMVEFRRTPQGRAVLMEINPRLWGSVQLAIDAGVDFPRLLVQLYRGEQLPQVTARTGIRMRWLLGDVDHLLLSLLRPRTRPDGVSAGSALGAFLRTFFDGTRSEVLRWDDPLPFVRELVDRVLRCGRG